MKKLWLYTEERPRKETICLLVERFANDNDFVVTFNDQISILPIVEGDIFTFQYKVAGISCEEVEEIIVATVSGNSSFADYIIFYSENKPLRSDVPLYVIEETKTDDKESRNTGVYQRCSKFVYADFFYPEATKIMLYSLKIPQKEIPTPTYIFGTKMLVTLGVEIMGKKLDPEIFVPFTTVDELIEEKNIMRDPYNGVPVKMTKSGDTILITAKLEKGERLSHDPNIGMTTIMASCLRKLGWEGEIIISEHGLADQKSVGKTNKFIQIANQIGISLEGLEIPNSTLADDYWAEEGAKEKLGTIFTSIICEEFTNAVAIYENHGGCERGYFIAEKEGEELKYVVIPKYTDREAYKAGDKSSIIYIPDVVIYDRDRVLIIDGEGKTYQNREQGYEEMNNFDFFENQIVAQYYPDISIQRTLVLYGGEQEVIEDPRVGLLLNKNGKIVVGEHSPEIFKEAVKKLLSR